MRNLAELSMSQSRSLTGLFADIENDYFMKNITESV